MCDCFIYFFRYIFMLCVLTIANFIVFLLLLLSVNLFLSFCGSFWFVMDSNVYKLKFL